MTNGFRDKEDPNYTSWLAIREQSEIGCIPHPKLKARQRMRRQFAEYWCTDKDRLNPCWYAATDREVYLERIRELSLVEFDAAMDAPKTLSIRDLRSKHHTSTFVWVDWYRSNNGKESLVYVCSKCSQELGPISRTEIRNNLRNYHHECASAPLTVQTQESEIMPEVVETTKNTGAHMEVAYETSLRSLFKKAAEGPLTAEESAVLASFEATPIGLRLHNGWKVYAVAPNGELIFTRETSAVALPVPEEKGEERIDRSFRFGRNAP